MSVENAPGGSGMASAPRPLLSPEARHCRTLASLEARKCGNDVPENEGGAVGDKETSRWTKD